MKWRFALSQLAVAATSARAEGRHGRAPSNAREADAVLLRSIDAVHESCQVDVATLCTGRRSNPFDGMDTMMRLGGGGDPLRRRHPLPAPFLLEQPPSLFAPSDVEMGRSPFDDIDAIMDGMFRQAMEFASPFLETTRSDIGGGEPVTKITVVRLGDQNAPRRMPLPVPMVAIRPMPGGDLGPADEVAEDPDAAIDRIFDNVIFSFLEDVQRSGLGGFGPVVGDVKSEKHEAVATKEVAMPERNNAQITREEIFGIDDDRREVSRDGKTVVQDEEKREEAADASAAMMQKTDAQLPKEQTSEPDDVGEGSDEDDEIVAPKEWKGFDDDLYDDFYFVFDDDVSPASSTSDEVGSPDGHEKLHRNHHEVDPAHLANALSAAGRELLRSSASASASRDGGADVAAGEEDPLRLRFARRLTEVAPSAPAVLRHREPRLHEDVVAPIVTESRSPVPLPIPPRLPDLRYGCGRVERCLWEHRHSPHSPFSVPLSPRCANALDAAREADASAREAHAREEAAASTTATTLRLVLRPPAAFHGGEEVQTTPTTFRQFAGELVANADPCALHLAALGFFTSLLCVVLLCGCCGSDLEDEEEEEEADEEGDDQVHYGYPGAVAMARRNDAIRREMALQNGVVAPVAETAGAQVFVAVPVVE